MHKAGAMAQFLRGLSYKQEGLSWIPSINIKKAAISNAIAGEAEPGGCL